MTNIYYAKEPAKSIVRISDKISYGNTSTSDYQLRRNPAYMATMSDDDIENTMTKYT
jgi:hypothetical protein